jgi:hypothetical protein
MPRPNRSRPLPRPLAIPTVMDLVTLADVRKLLGHLPKETREINLAARRGRAQQGRGRRRPEELIDRTADGADAGKRGVPVTLGCVVSLHVGTASRAACCFQYDRRGSPRSRDCRRSPVRAPRAGLRSGNCRIASRRGERELATVQA